LSITILNPVSTTDASTQSTTILNPVSTTDASTQSITILKPVVGVGLCGSAGSRRLARRPQPVSR
jgi:hypothetical protein